MAEQKRFLKLQRAYRRTKLAYPLRALGLAQNERAGYRSGLKLRVDNQQSGLDQGLWVAAPNMQFAIARDRGARQGGHIGQGYGRCGFSIGPVTR